MKKSLKRVLVLVTCSICFLILVASSSGPLKPDEAIDKIKHTTREEIANIIYYYVKKETRIDDVVMFYSLLDNKDTIDAGRKFKENIQVRDIALICIEEITGESFAPMGGKTYPGKAIILYTSKDDGSVARFYVPHYSDDDFEEIKITINQWISDFKKKGRDIPR